MTDDGTSATSPDPTPVTPPASAPAPTPSAPQPYGTAPAYTTAAVPPAPGYVAAPGTYAPRPPTGAKSYALGFLSYIPIPFVGLLIGAIVMAAVYPSAKRGGGLAAENAKRAANWGLTVIAVMLVLVLWTLLLSTVFNGYAWSTPLGPVLVFLALAVTHVVVLIVALVKLNAGTVFANPLAVPFLR